MGDYRGKHFTAEKISTAGINVLLYKPMRRNELAKAIQEVMVS
jgi:hypothetical protein